MDPTNTSISAGLERKMDDAILRYPAEHKRSAAMPLRGRGASLWVIRAERAERVPRDHKSYAGRVTDW